MGSQHFSLKWNDHQTNLLKVFEQCLSTESLVDVTLACEGHSLKAHKMVLSACSSFFQSLFLQNPCQHPIVIMKDIKYADLKAIVYFMYHGEVNVTQNELSQLLQVAETLHVKGLSQLRLMGQKETTEIVQQAGEEPKHHSHQVKTEPGLNFPASSRKKRRRHRSSSSSNNSDSKYETFNGTKLDNALNNETDLQQRTDGFAQKGFCHQAKCVSSPTQFSHRREYDNEQSLNDECILAIHPSDILRQSMERNGPVGDLFHNHPASAENGSVDYHESPDIATYREEYNPSVHAISSLVSDKDKKGYELSYPTVSQHNSRKVKDEVGVQILNKFCSSTSVTDDDCDDDDDEHHSGNDGNELCQSVSISAVDEENTGATNSFICSTCNLTFRNVSDLVSHKRVIHSYITDGKNVSEGFHIQQQAQTHTTDRRFKCHLCKKKFMMKSTCIKHLRAHVTNTGTNKQYSEETDSEERNLLLYEKRDTVNRVYLCVFCHKGFRSKSDLRKHHIIHTGLKPFVCDKCGKTFNRKSNLDRHKKTCGTRK